LAFVSTSEGSGDRTPGAASNALAIKISVPGQADTTTPVVASPPAAQPQLTSAFAYPGDGSVVSAASTTASATTDITQNAAAQSEADVTNPSIFNGEITAAAVTARASAGTGPSGAGGNTLGSGVTSLVADGQPISGAHAVLGNWGQLTLGAIAVDRSAP